jgi:RNA polymerase sigma-70 factor (ECF subfamily)
MDELPAAQRQVLELAYFEGLSSTEIAERIECPVGTVKSRTAAAMNKLRTVLGEEAGP